VKGQPLTSSPSTANDNSSRLFGTGASDLAGASTKNIRNPRRYLLTHVYNPHKVARSESIIASEVTLGSDWVVFKDDAGRILAAYKASLVQVVELVSDP